MRKLHISNFFLAYCLLFIPTIYTIIIYRLITMETELSVIKPTGLVEKTEELGKLSLELLKLKSLEKTADASATLISRLIFVLIASVFLLMLNIGLALWIGELLGKTYYGFFILASFYAIFALSIFFSHNWLKTKIEDTIITKMFN